jgi:hypothetical protein
LCFQHSNSNCYSGVCSRGVRGGGGGGPSNGSGRVAMDTHPGNEATIVTCFPFGPHRSYRRKANRSQLLDKAVNVSTLPGNYILLPAPRLWQRSSPVWSTGWLVLYLLLLLNLKPSSTMRIYKDIFTGIVNTCHVYFQRVNSGARDYRVEVDF